MNAPFVLRDDLLEVVLTPSDDTFFLTLKDLKSGLVRQSSSFPAVTVYDKMERRCMTRNRFPEASVKTAFGQLRMEIPCKEFELSFALWLAVQNGELVIRFEMPELYEHKPSVFRLFKVALPEKLLTVGPEEDGLLLLPIHSGLACNPKGKPPLKEFFMIYGEQSRWEFLPTLPVCAAGGATGGLIALAVEGAAETECFAATDGNGGGWTGLHFSFRRTWMDKLYPGTRRIHIVPVSPGIDLLTATAKRLRRHIMEDHRKPTLRERIEESPEVKYLQNASIMKIFHGMQKMGMLADTKDDVSDLDPFVPTMTFPEASAAMQKLHDAGIGQILFQCVGWNPRGHDGLWPTRFPIEPRLGGETEFREMIRTGHSLGYQVSVHDNFLSQYTASPDFDPSTLIYDQWGNPDLRGFWGGGETCLTHPLQVKGERREGQMLRMKTLGLSGMYYLDGMGNPLECNYRPGQPASRSEYAQGTMELLRTARKIFGSCGTECGFLYAALEADCIVTCGNEFMIRHLPEDSAILSFCDRFVPLWQLALHGLLFRENGKCNEWSSAMRCILFGDHPRDEWSARPDFMPVLDDRRIASLKAKHDLCLTRFGFLQMLELTRWENPEPGMEQSTFEDGTTVLADFNRRELFVNGEKIPRPDALDDI